MNLAEKALLTSRAAEQTRLMREKVASALVVTGPDREPLLIDSLEAAVKAMDAMTNRLLAEIGEVE